MTELGLARVLHVVLITLTGVVVLAMMILSALAFCAESSVK